MFSTLTYTVNDLKDNTHDLKDTHFDNIGSGKILIFHVYMTKIIFK